MRDTSHPDAADTPPVEPRSNLLLFVPRSQFAMKAKRAAEAQYQPAKPQADAPLPAARADNVEELLPKKPAQ